MLFSGCLIFFIPPTIGGPPPPQTAGPSSRPLRTLSPVSPPPSLPSLGDIGGMHLPWPAVLPAAPLHLSGWQGPCCSNSGQSIAFCARNVGMDSLGQNFFVSLRAPPEGLNMIAEINFDIKPRNGLLDLRHCRVSHARGESLLPLLLHRSLPFLRRRPRAASRQRGLALCCSPSNHASGRLCASAGSGGHLGPSYSLCTREPLSVRLVARVVVCDHDVVFLLFESSLVLIRSESAAVTGPVTDSEAASATGTDSEAAPTCSEFVPVPRDLARARSNLSESELSRDERA